MTSTDFLQCLLVGLVVPIIMILVDQKCGFADWCFSRPWPRVLLYLAVWGPVIIGCVIYVMVF